MQILLRLLRRDAPYILSALAITGMGYLAFSESSSVHLESVGNNERVIGGEELLFVVIVSERCRATGNESLSRNIRSAEKTLSELASGNGLRFVRVGIALDWDVEAGLKTLSRFAEFDEVASGRKWENAAVEKYLINDHPGPLAVPQVLVLSREVLMEDAGPSLQDEKVLLRRVGVQEIDQWKNLGFPLNLHVR